MESKQSKGGKARAKALSQEKRSEIAQKAAEARWRADTPRALCEGPVNIGPSTLQAAVLPGGIRVLSQADFLRSIGRSRSPKAGTGIMSTADKLPFFLQANALKPYISEGLRESTAPVFYLSVTDKKLVGYKANLLPKVCEVYLSLRDDSLKLRGKIPKQFEHIVLACDLLMRGLAHVGITALVDEATGYQEIRDLRALQAILDQYLRKELAAWAKKFPDEFYKEMFRLRNWQWRGMKINRPSVVGKYTNNLVYERIAPGLLEELQQKNPRNTSGRRKAKHHQWLTEDVGDPALAQHLHAVVGLMRASTDWGQFKRLMDRSFPRKGQNLELPMEDFRDQ